MPLTVGELVGYLDLDTNPFTKNLNTAMRSAEQQGGRMRQVGADLTRNLTLPLAGIGIAAGKLSLDFEATFSRMQGLAGVSAEEVDGLKESVMGLAGETGKAPQELAEALYFIRSAGLAGQEALDALEFSAKGAAAGLGSTVDVADAVTSAMNAYAAEGLTAARATDALVAAAEIGKVEASELAPQLGRLAGTAASLGIGFDDLSATVAFLSRTNGDASLSATQMQGALAKLLSPGSMGTKTLDAIGLSLEDIRAVADRDGLPAALELLRTKLESAGMEFSNFAEDQQFIQAALALTGNNFEAASAAIDQGRDSADKAESAFATFAESAGFKNQQAFAELQTALIGLGDILVPLATDVAGFASELIGWFDALPGPVKTFAVVLGIAAAAAGPLISAGGAMYRVLGKVTSAMETTALKGMYLGDNLGSIAGRAAGLATQLGIAYAATQLLGGEADRADLSKLENSLLDVAEAGRVSGESASVFGDDLGKLRSSIEQLAAPSNATKLANVLEAPFRALGDTDDDLSQARARIDDLDTALSTLAARDPDAAAASLQALVDGLPPEDGERLIGMLDKYDSALSQVDTAQRTTADSAGELPPELDAQAQAVIAATEALQGYDDQLSKMFDPIFAMQDAVTAEAEARTALNEAIRAHGPASEEAVVAQDQLARAMAETDAAALSLQQAVIAGDVSMDDFRARLAAWVEQGRYTQGQADALAGRVEFLTGVSEGYAGTYSADFHANTAQAEAAIQRVRDGIASVTGRFSAGISTAFWGGQQKDAGGPIEGPLGSPQMVLAHAGEIVLPTHRMGLGAALQHTLGMSSAPALTGQQSGGRHFEVHGDLVVQTRDSFREAVNESLWRVSD